MSRIFFLYRSNVRMIAGHGTQVEQPVGKRDDLGVSPRFGYLLYPPMEVTENRLQIHHHLPVQDNPHPKDAMSGWVLRPHIENEVFSLEFRIYARQRLHSILGMLRMNDLAGHCSSSFKNVAARLNSFSSDAALPYSCTRLSISPISLISLLTLDSTWAATSPVIIPYSFFIWLNPNAAS